MRFGNSFLIGSKFYWKFQAQLQYWRSATKIAPAWDTRFILPLFKTIICAIKPPSGDKTWKFRLAHLLTPKAHAIYEENLEWPTQDLLQVEVYRPSWHNFRCILKNWSWSSFYDLRSLPWNRQGLFFHTSPRLTGLAPLEGPISPSGFIWEISARSPRWEKAEDDLWREIRETN